MMSHNRIQLFSFVLAILLLCISATSIFAVAPSKEVIEKWKNDGVLEEKMAFLRDFHARGGCSPVEQGLVKKNNGFAAGTEVADTVRVIVLMVDFNDHPASNGIPGTVADFDSILFSDGYINPSGSMTDFYMENSYGNFYVKGDIFGWYRMPENYSYYTNGNYGMGSYPNSQTLVWHAIDAAQADPSVDFSNYDFDNDGNCDGIVLIHSGPGAEVTGNVNDIWSHKWNLEVPRVIDGVVLSNYNMNPEEYGTGPSAELSPIGVFCHEYGHFLGLPDLYDTDQSHTTSEGLGRWSLMASGNYNGDSKYPAHFDPWCKDQIGFLDLIDVTENLYNVEIPPVQTTPVAYRLINELSYDGFSKKEYFIVENRQKIGFDSRLPGEGLLIYHVDDNQYNNNNILNYKVALEQADGEDALAWAGSRGDNKDPYPGFTNNRNFHEFSLPSSILYSGFESHISVWNISDSDSLMYADLDVGYSRPWIEGVGVDAFVMDDSFYGNGDGALEPGETILFYFKVRNLMRTSYNVRATLSSNNSGLQFNTNDITMLGEFGTTTVTNAALPIEFTIPDTVTPHIDSFFLTISTDSLGGIPGGETYSKTFGFEYTVGKPNILIVDGDRGDSYEQDYVNSLYDKRVPADIWDINLSGTPTIGDIVDYDMIFWHTGDSVGSGAVSNADISVMKQYLDAGKNLMLSTLTGIDDIVSLDPDFLTNYFHADKDASIRWPLYTGVPGSQTMDGMSFRPLQQQFYTCATLTPVGQGLPILTAGPTNSEICGVSYEGTYKSVLLSIAVELIDDNQSGYNTKSDLMSKVVDFFGGIPTSIYDGNPFTQIPDNFELTQNYPNPFNPTTTIQYTIHATKEIGTRTKLEIFNVLGQNVKTLVDEVQIPGHYSVEWNGTDNTNRKVSSGIYLYRLTRGTDAQTKKMTLLK